METGNKLYQSEDWLLEKYWYEKLSIRQISEKFGHSKSTIRKYMKKFQIPKRSLSEARLANYPDKPYRNKKVLYRKYWREGNSLDELSKLWACDKQTIKFWLDKYSIRKRGKEEWLALRKKTNKRRLYGSWWNRLKLVARDFIQSFRRYF